MTHRVEFVPEKNLVRKIYSGDIGLEDLMRANQEEWGDPRFRPGMNIVCDFRDAHVHLTFDEMARYAAFLERGPKGGNQAILVDRNVEYGCARMFESLTDDATCWAALGIFYDEADAEAWIAGSPPVTTQGGDAANECP